MINKNLPNQSLIKRLSLGIVIIYFFLSVAYACSCFKSGEKISGLNKICYYNCCGSGAAITVKNYEMCPLSISNYENMHEEQY